MAFTNGTTTSASSWANLKVVPEPTSGLLMLLGMAGLALRRRRA
ncbi:MAG: PEP-CTERM sorting domain-containing protein [Kiritimatiellae bacterium]|nr:PEP-CTERM sorting domain-containing protein [Kiritimatiellia bacterium]